MIFAQSCHSDAAAPGRLPEPGVRGEGSGGERCVCSAPGPGWEHATPRGLRARHVRLC